MFVKCVLYQAQVICYIRKNKTNVLNEDTILIGLLWAQISGSKTSTTQV